MKRCNKTIRMLHVRIKDRHTTLLTDMASAVNFVFNYCNELSMKVLEREQRFIGTAEMQKYLAGASKEGLIVGSAVFQQVAEEYVTRRIQFRKRRLAWRKSTGTRRSLGWIPFKARSLSYRNGQIHFQGHVFKLWDSYGLSKYQLRSGCFSEDSRGRWYLNIAVEVEQAAPSTGKADLGIDLGLKHFAGFSDESIENIEAKRFYRDPEPKLAVAQRANKKRQVKKIHATIANRRKDYHHQLSTELVRNFGAIFVGNVNASALAQTHQAKSVLDAGWSAFRTMLQYKCADAGVWFDEVNETFSTQDCSVCLARTGPKGLSGLGIRVWICPECGTKHDRDRNAARNILRRGRATLAGGIPVL